MSRTRFLIYGIVATASLLGGCCRLTVRTIATPLVSALRSMPLAWAPFMPNAGEQLVFTWTAARTDERALMWSASFSPNPSTPGHWSVIRVATDGSVQRGTTDDVLLNPAPGTRGFLLSSMRYWLSGTEVIPVQDPRPSEYGAAAFQASVSDRDELLLSVYGGTGIGPRVYRSTNSGLSWSKPLQAANATGSNFIVGLLALQSLNRTVVAYRSSYWGGKPNSEMFVSRDGGATWAGPVGMPVLNQFQLYGSSLTTDDYLVGCDTWSSLPSYLVVSTLTGQLRSRQPMTCNATSFVTSQSGLVSTQLSVYATNNGGATMKKILDAPAGQTVFAIDAVSAATFIVVTQTTATPLVQHVQITTDGGAKWTETATIR